MQETVISYKTAKRLNVYESYGGATRIKLTKGKWAFIDTEDIPKVAHIHWHIHEGKKFTTTYCRGSKWENGKAVGVMLHRIITGANPGQLVDHINHNGLDNRKCNLRICTAQENNRSVVKRKKGTSIFKGVYYDKRRHDYKATITVNKKTITIGYYKKEIDAAKAYNERALKLFGDFAVFNDISPAVEKALEEMMK